MTYSLRAVNADGSTPAGGGLLPDYSKLSVGVVFSDIGSITFDYALNGNNADLVTDQTEIALFDHIGEIPDTRCVIEGSNGQRASRDGINYRSWTARSLWKLFDEALVYGLNWPTLKSEEKRTFTTSTPGAILKSVIDQSQALGEMSGLTYTFSATVDSGGNAWAGTTNLEVETGTTILALITKMVENGLIEVRMYGRELRVYNPNELGVDHTTGSTPLTLWTAWADELPEQRDSKGLRSVVVVKGDNGVKVEVTDAGALAAYGRRTMTVSQSGVTDTGTLTAIGQVALARVNQVRSERSLKYPILVGETPVPFRDYLCGDWVYNDMNGTPERVRVTQITIESEASDDAPSVIVTLNDLFMEQDVALARKISGITGGSQLDSSKPANPSDPGTDILAPKAPTGLTGSSTAYVVNNGQTWAQVTLDWNDVVQNTDDSAINDLDRYEVYGRQVIGGTTYKLYTATDGSVTTLSPFPPGQEWIWYVVAVDTTGNRSAASSTFSITMASDTTAPPVPSTPIVTDYLGTVRIYWDGLGNLGEAMPGDFKYVEVHTSTTSGFTPSSTTLSDTLDASGYSSVTDLPYGTPVYVQLRSVDKSNNTSTSSTEATATPARVSGLDVNALAIETSHLGDGAVTAAKIMDATITSAKIGTAQILNANIANAAIDDAKISSVSAGKITVGTLIADITVSSRIKTADTGARSEMSSTGFHAFNSSGVETFTADSSGNVQLVGRIRTGSVTGQHIEMHTSGAQPLIMFYQDDGTTFASMQEVDNIDFLSQTKAGIAINSSPFVTTDGTTELMARLYVGAGMQMSGQIGLANPATQSPWGGRWNISPTVANLQVYTTSAILVTDLQLTTTSATLTTRKSGGGNQGFFETNATNTRLVYYDASSVQRGDITCNTGGITFSYRNASNQVVGAMSCDASNTMIKQLIGSSGNTAAQLYCTSAGQALMQAYDTSNHNTGLIWTDDAYASMQARNTSGTVLAEHYVNANGVYSTFSTKYMRADASGIVLSNTAGNYINMYGATAIVSSADLFLSCAGINTIWIGDGTEHVCSMPIYNATTSGGANLNIEGAYGRIMRSTSSIFYKTDVEPMDLRAEDFLALEPKSWIDRHEKAENGGISEGLRRHVGLIAEDLDAIPGMRWAVNYDADGNPDAIMYERLVVALIPVIRQLWQAVGGQLPMFENRITYPERQQKPKPDRIKPEPPKDKGLEKANKK